MSRLTFDLAPDTRHQQFKNELREISSRFMVEDSYCYTVTDHCNNTIPDCKVCPQTRNHSCHKPVNQDLYCHLGIVNHISGKRIHSEDCPIWMKRTIVKCTNE
jgi:hypothetical protein